MMGVSSKNFAIMIKRKRKKVDNKTRPAYYVSVEKTPRCPPGPGVHVTTEAQARAS